MLFQNTIVVENRHLMMDPSILNRDREMEKPF